MPDKTPTPTTICQPSALDPLPDIIPVCGISLLAGAPSVGKTALLATIARDFYQSRSIFGHQPTPLAGIAVINADRGWDRGAGVWFERAGFAGISYYSMADDPTFDPRSLRRKFERTTRLVEFIDRLKLPQRSLVIVDPIALFLGGNLLDYDTCAVSCHELRKALQIRGLTMLAAAHSSKLKADKKDRYLRLQDQILGSTALFGFTDTQMYLAAPEETAKPYYTFMWQSHLAPAEFFYLERDEQGLFVPYSGVDEGNCTRVLVLFPEDGSEVALSTLLELIQAIPLSRNTLRRVLDTLMERDRVKRVRHGVYKRVVVN